MTLNFIFYQFVQPRAIIVLLWLLAQRSNQVGEKNYKQTFFRIMVPTRALIKAS